MTGKGKSHVEGGDEREGDERAGWGKIRDIAYQYGINT